jgi:hypothetical protein
MAIRIDINADEVQATGKALLRISLSDIFQAIRQPVFRSLNIAKNAIRTNLSGSVLNRRTGVLAASVDTEGPAVQGAAMLARLGILRGPARRYADIHLTGGVIRPVNAQKLAVPLSAALTASGVAAFPDGTFVAKDIIFGKVGRVEIVPLFVLKDQVVIPKRDYMSGPLQALIRSVSQDVATGAAQTILKQNRNAN